MGVTIDAAKKRFSNIVEARKAVSFDVTFGVGYYRDEVDEDTFVNVQSITTDTGLVQDAVDSLSVDQLSPTPDKPEGNLVALYNIAMKPGAIGWRSDSRQILVCFGDAPGHEPSSDGSLKLTRKNIVDALNKEKITVVAGNLNVGGSLTPFKGLDTATKEFSCYPGTDAGAGQPTTITAQTGGKFVEAANQEELIETILNTVGGLSQELEADTSGCDSRIIDVLFKCKLKFTLCGVSNGEQTLTSAGLAGC